MARKEAETTAEETPKTVTMTVDELDQLIQRRLDQAIASDKVRSADPTRTTAKVGGKRPPVLNREKATNEHIMRTFMAAPQNMKHLRELLAECDPAKEKDATKRRELSERRRAIVARVGKVVSRLRDPAVKAQAEEWAREALA